MGTSEKRLLFEDLAPDLSNVLVREPPIKPHYPTLRTIDPTCCSNATKAIDRQSGHLEHIEGVAYAIASQNAHRVAIRGRSVTSCPSAAIREGGPGSQRGW